VRYATTCPCGSALDMRAMPWTISRYVGLFLTQHAAHLAMVTTDDEPEADEPNEYGGDTSARVETAAPYWGPSIGFEANVPYGRATVESEERGHNA